MSDTIYKRLDSKGNSNIIFKKLFDGRLTDVFLPDDNISVINKHILVHDTFNFYKILSNGVIVNETVTPYFIDNKAIKDTSLVHTWITYIFPNIKVIKDNL